MQVSDNFQRPDGFLGANWLTFGLSVEGTYPGTTGLPTLSNHGYSPTAVSSFDGLAIWNGTGAGSFGDDQYSSAQIKSFAAPLSTLSITAAVQSGGNTTYTYTVVSGATLAALPQPPFLYISGMQNAGNNGAHVVTGTGVGTFTVTNASGVTESGSSGTAIAPADSLCGVAVRASSNGSTQSAYWFFAGPNTFEGGFAYTRELWKVVNGVGTMLAGEPHNANPDSVGDIYSLAVIGSLLRVAKNGVLLPTFSKTDTDISSGTPGLWTWSVAGPNEYNWSQWGGSVMAGAPGNNGTVWTNWYGGDISSAVAPLASDAMTEGEIFTQIAADTFNRADGSVGPNWTVVNGSFAISGDDCVGATASVFNHMYWNANAFSGSQYSTIQVVADTIYVAPTVRTQAGADSGYILYGAGGTASLFSRINGANASIGSGSISFSPGDTLTIAIVNSAIVTYKNGVLTACSASDSTLAGGNPGVSIFGNGGGSNAAIKNWVGGTFSSYPSTFSTGNASQSYFSDTTLGVFADAVDSDLLSVLYPNSITFPEAQYSQTTQSASTSGNGTEVFGPAVLISPSGDSAYSFTPVGSVSQAWLSLVQNGSFTILDAESQNYSQGQSYKLETHVFPNIPGILLIGKVNGTSVASAWDNTLTSGSSGLLSRTVGSATISLGTFKNWSGGSIAFGISGSLGSNGAGATVSWSGTSSGSTTADGSGNYTIFLANGSYTITPSLTGYVFTPTNRSETVSGSNITGVNFTAAKASGKGDLDYDFRIRF